MLTVKRTKLKVEASAAFLRRLCLPCIAIISSKKSISNTCYASIDVLQQMEVSFFKRLEVTSHKEHLFLTVVFLIFGIAVHFRLYMENRMLFC